jgi:hypothetical protein
MALLTLDNKNSVTNLVKAPIIGAWRWFPLFLLTTATTYGSAEFGQQHNLFPMLVAWCVAVGVEWTYLSGLAYADQTRSHKYVWPMIVVGALTSGLYGTLFVLGQYGVIPNQPDKQTALWLALAHVVPLIALLFCYTIVKRQYSKERQAQDDFLAELDRREKERKQREADLKLRLTEAKIEIAIDTARSKASSVLTKKDEFFCPRCNMRLNAFQFASAKRWGRCKACNASH